jgi:hypothetical protein
LVLLRPLILRRSLVLGLIILGPILLGRPPWVLLLLLHGKGLQ